jgi:hypothetical protein
MDKSETVSATAVSETVSETVAERAMLNDGRAEREALIKADLILEAAQDATRGGTHVSDIRRMMATRITEIEAMLCRHGENLREEHRGFWNPSYDIEGSDDNGATWSHHWPYGTKGEDKEGRIFRRVIPRKLTQPHKGGR